MVDQAVPPPRATVAVGLNNFRGVVRTVNESCILKFFCCSAADGGCPGSTAADRAGFGEGENEYHLFNIAQDRFELPSSEAKTRPSQSAGAATSSAGAARRPQACFTASASARLKLN